MQIIVLNDNSIVVDIIQTKDLSIDGNNVTHDTGKLQELKNAPVILEDNITVTLGEALSSDIINLDRSQDFIYINETQAEIDALSLEILKLKYGF